MVEEIQMDCWTQGGTQTRGPFLVAASPGKKPSPGSRLHNLGRGIPMAARLQLETSAAGLLPPNAS